jgi:hypothetical protein
MRQPNLNKIEEIPMSTVKRQTFDVPNDKLAGTDQMFGRMMSMDIEKMPAKFQNAFDKTKEASYGNFHMKGIVESFEIESIDGERIKLKNGFTLESRLMAEIFHQAFELVMIVVSLSGYEELDEAENNMFLKLFLDSWGTAFIECGNKWMEQTIAMDLEGKNIYCTHSFSPGQGEIPMEMQAQLFQALNPQEIGVTINDRYMMHPKKTVSGIFGIQTEKIENRIRPCDLCEKRDTCPTAYA